MFVLKFGSLLSRSIFGKNARLYIALLFDQKLPNFDGDIFWQKFGPLLSRSILDKNARL